MNLLPAKAARKAEMLKTEKLKLELPGELLAARLREEFARRRVVYQDEADLQRIIGDLLTEMREVYVREFEFSKEDRIDFFLFGSGIGIEIKIQGGLNPILRQLHRYAMHPAVKAIILICPRPWKLPETLAGKPIYGVSIFASLL